MPYMWPLDFVSKVIGIKQREFREKGDRQYCTEVNRAKPVYEIKQGDLSFLGQIYAANGGNPSESHISTSPQAFKSQLPSSRTAKSQMTGISSQSESAVTKTNSRINPFKSCTECISNRLNTQRLANFFSTLPSPNPWLLLCQG